MNIMATINNTTLIEENTIPDELKARMINLALEMKLLDENEQQILLLLVKSIKTSELMDIVNTMNPILKKEKITKLITSR
jgi:helix-turn-helix protein